MQCVRMCMSCGSYKCVVCHTTMHTWTLRSWKSLMSCTSACSSFNWGSDMFVGILGREVVAAVRTERWHVRPEGACRGLGVELHGFN
jgi:hypothetical protein